MSRQQTPSTPTNQGNTRKASSRDGTQGSLSVREAGRKGGQRVRELISRGRQAEQRENAQRQ